MKPSRFHSVFKTLGFGSMAAKPRLNTSAELSGTGFEGDLPEVESFAQFLPYDAILEESFVVLSSSDPSGPEGLGFVIELTPQTGVTAEMEKTLAALFCAPLPVGSTVSMTVYASPSIENHLDIWRSSHASGLGELPTVAREISRRSTAQRAELFARAAREQIFEHAPVEVRHFRVWLSVVIKTDDPAGEKTLFEAKRTASSFEALLSQNVLNGGLWRTEDYMRTLRELLNPQKARGGRIAEKFHSSHSELRWQLVDRDTELEIGKRGLKFSGGAAARHEVEAVGLSAESYPARIDLARFSLLLGEPIRSGSQIPCPYLITALLEIPDAPSEKARMNAMTLRSRQMMGTPIGSLIPHYHEAWKNYSAASKSFDGAGGVARVLHQMVLFAPAGKAADCVQAAQSLGRKISIEFLENTALHAQAYLTILPLGAGPGLMSDLERMRRLTKRTASTVACALPVMTEYRGTGPRPGAKETTPLLMLAGRKGQIFFVDLFANAHGSYSATIVGKPGSGKSVVMNELAASTLMTGGRVWVIDAGYSYQKLASVLGGTFFEFSDDQVWNLDPFAFLLEAQDSQEDSAEMLEMVAKILVELMTAKGLDDFSESILTRAVQDAAAVLRRGSAEGSSIDLLREALLSYRLPGSEQIERRALEMAAMLEPYASCGVFAKWFDGTGRPLDFSSAKLCVLELDGLSSHKRLRAGVLMTLMLTIDRAMRRLPKSVAKLVLIDEAWDLMGEGSSGRFIESGYRRARKLNGAFVTATQSIADFHLSDTAQAAWRCADTRIFLRQDADSLEALEHDGRLARDPWLKEAIASLTTVAGAWSEMVVKVGDDPAAIGRLILDPYSRVVYSTLPAEVDSVNRWKAAGLDLAGAIEMTAAGKLPPE